MVKHLLSEQKQSPYCYSELHKIGEDRSEKLEFTPTVLKVLEYVRPKYVACPVSLIPKSFATESLLTNTILGKYQYALSLYRQEALFNQSGMSYQELYHGPLGDEGL